jgi:septum formation protein
LADRPPLVLASTSPYRAELLRRLRVPFEIASPGVDEAALAGERCADTALRLASAKARAVSARFRHALIIGSDQVAELDGEPLEKPGEHDRALSQLRRLQGRVAIFHTAVVLLDARAGREQSALVPTRVRYRRLSDAELRSYLAKEQPYDCAGSAKAEALGIVLADEIESRDPTAMIGLPLIALSAMLAAAGLPVL